MVVNQLKFNALYILRCTQVCNDFVSCLFSTLAIVFFFIFLSKCNKLKWIVFKLIFTTEGCELF
jgi:hypothetical protein